jgi:ribosomal peptide maturation radical SAM protein 1
MRQVMLLNMPFVSLSRPAIGISILKARLAQEGVECGIGYGNLLFAERVGLHAYNLINERLSSALFAGDWLFSEFLFPEVDRSGYITLLQHHLSRSDFETVMSLRCHVQPFLETCLKDFQIEKAEIVGFTTTFEQNMASLAFAKVIKNKFPAKTIVFGGGNCEGVMGLELHRRFPWVDYVCSGESDNSFAALTRYILAGSKPETIPGVIHREDGQSRLTAAPDKIHDMDRLPDPDYDDYFAALNRSPIRGEIKPALLIESARGCWWGAKSHCTFCGLNGSTMAFRAKSARRVFDELVRQKNRYGIGRFLAVDNIMSYEYFRDLLPMLKEHNPGISLFYEIKSNLKPAQVEMLRDAGVLAIQPGIESLNTHVLQLMKKGVSSIHNVQLLRLCREYGIELAWNLLYGFPGETPNDYLQTAEIVESVYHLKPPGAVAPIRLDRFSPNYDQATNFGLVKVRPFQVYRHIYPFPPESVANLAYFFEYEYSDGRQPKSYVAPALEKVKIWKENRHGDLIKQYGNDPELMLLDSRPGRPALHYPLNGVQREIYDYCSEIRNYTSISSFANQRAGKEVAISAFLNQLLDYRLMLREGNSYLSLAVDTSRKREHCQEAATF